jgi:hypothetical protein
VFWNEHSFINRPAVTKSPMSNITTNYQNALSYFAAIIEDSVDTSIKTCENIEEYEAFIGTPIPSPTELILDLEVIHSNGGQNSTRDAHVFERLTESDRVNTKSFCFSISQDDGTGINFDVWSNTPYACTSTINFNSNHIIYDGFTEVNKDDEIYKVFTKVFATSRLNSDNIQASRAWNEEITQSLIKYGLKQSITDPCMFSKYNQINADLELHVAVSTDDLLGATSNIQHWTNFCQFISSDYGGRYKTSQVDSVIKSVINFNGLEIRRESKHKISVNLNSYTKLMNDDFKSIYKYITTKEFPKYKERSNAIKDNHQPCTPIEIKEYQSIIGQYIWLASNTRPDLAHFASSAGKAAKSPTKFHLSVVRQSLGYLFENPEMSIVFDGTNVDEVRLVAHSDAGEGRSIFTQHLPNSDDETTRYTTGYVTSLGSGAITWKSKRQERTAASVCHAELQAALSCLAQVTFTSNLLDDMGYPQTRTLLFIDNRASIFLMQKNMNLKKHDVITVHLLQRAVEDGRIMPVYIPTADNIADAFTKPNPFSTQATFDLVISKVTGNFDSTQYRDQIRDIINKHYTDIFKNSKLPSAGALWDYITNEHNVSTHKRKRLEKINFIQQHKQ